MPENGQGKFIPQYNLIFQGKKINMKNNIYYKGYVIISKKVIELWFYTKQSWSSLKNKNQQLYVFGG